MRIIIDESEIKEAIVALVKSQVSIQEGQEITVELKATRGETGNTAEITINAPAVPSTPVKRTPRVRAVDETKTEVIVQEKAQEPAEELPVTHSVDESNEEKDRPVDDPRDQQVVSRTEEEQVAESIREEEDKAVETAAEDPSAKKTTGSLFSTLKRPVNG